LLFRNASNEARAVDEWRLQTANRSLAAVNDASGSTGPDKPTVCATAVDAI